MEKGYIKKYGDLLNIESNMSFHYTFRTESSRGKRLYFVNVGKETIASFLHHWIDNETFVEKDIFNSLQTCIDVKPGCERTVRYDNFNDELYDISMIQPKGGELIWPIKKYNLY